MSTVAEIVAVLDGAWAHHSAADRVHGLELHVSQDFAHYRIDVSLCARGGRSEGDPARSRWSDGVDTRHLYVDATTPLEVFRELADHGADLLNDEADAPAIEKYENNDIPRSKPFWTIVGHWRAP